MPRRRSLVLVAAVLVVAGCSRPVPPAALVDLPDDACLRQVLGPEPDVRCLLGRRPERFEALAEAAAQAEARSTAPFDSVAPGAHAAAVDDASRLRATAVGGPWRRVGVGPATLNDPGFPSGDGLVHVAGRVSDLARDPATGRWFAGVASGGVWESIDRGAGWRSIGDLLPTQSVGAVAWTAADGGILLAGTGDGAFGANSFSGLGVFRTTDGGATWRRSTGIPDGGLTFRLAVDPADQRVVYAATSTGLWRSTDVGATFANVALPTGCAEVTSLRCFFANMTTDVVVRSTGGRVLAAVGWRAGTKQNLDGTPQAPGNGLYVSATGAPGSFTRADSSARGFPAQAQLGRISLGATKAVGQNPDIVYALVQDAIRFNTGTSNEGVGANTVLDGVYGSRDFGTTWNRLASSTQLQSPTTRSALAGSADFGPGVQAWFNQWIEVDPTRTDAAGAPTRLLFGLEEVWDNASALNASTAFTVPDSVQFRVVGRYRPSGTPTTVHPDQHYAMFVPESDGGVTLVAASDGGVYVQRVAAGADFQLGGWGTGANLGFDTLQPYDAAVAKDDTVYAGLQDNGELKIRPDGRQIGIRGGDGLISAVDPNNANTAYAELPRGELFVTTDGGKGFRRITPALTSPLFVTPLTMDPLDADHLLIGGRNIQETTSGPASASSSFTQVFDLGTPARPGDGSAQRGTGVNNQLSAVDVRGDAVYAGYCGGCDPSLQGTQFASGIATNVGGTAPALRGTPAGWHIATAAGLPDRYITSVHVDPVEPRTVYAALGGYGRRWVPPGAVADDISRVGTGHVFRSTDAGETFTDISGNLPDAPANSVIVRGGGVVVATDVGVFASAAATGGEWEALGTGLPLAPVVDVQVHPGDADTIVVATFGRGVWSHSLSRLTAFPRIGGADRVATAIAAAREGFTSGSVAGGAVLARADGFADALAGAPLAAAVKGPLLLTPSGALDGRVQAELRRVLAKGKGTVHLLGGAAALGPAVEEAVKAMGFTAVRHAGTTRFDTAAAVADAIVQPSVILLADGTAFADAMAAGAAAAAGKGVVLLTQGRSLPQATAGAIAARSGVPRHAVGGPAATADPGASAIVGADRYDTAVRVANRFFPTPASVAVASGAAFPDALAGGALVGGRGGPLLLTPPTALNDGVRDYLRAKRASLRSRLVLGGPSAISEDVRTALRLAVAP